MRRPPACESVLVATDLVWFTIVRYGEAETLLQVGAKKSGSSDSELSLVIKSPFTITSLLEPACSAVIIGGGVDLLVTSKPVSAYLGGMAYPL